MKRREYSKKIGGADDPRDIEADGVRQEAFNKAYKATKAKEAFNKAFKDYEIKKEILEAKEAFKAFNKAECYKAAEAAEEKAKATEEAAKKAFYQAKENADKTKKVAKKADKKDGEAFNKMKKLSAAYKKAEEALNRVSTETAFNEALAAEKAFDQVREARNVKKAEADKTKKVAEKAAKKVEEAKPVFDQAKERVEKAVLRTRNAREAAVDAGLHINIHSTCSAKPVYRVYRERRKVG